ncbi:MAG: hypothetical protein JWO51_2430 [Rhodospirillales bacterium]|nr:hypothetical protein [Rhodospirillales bacterium]
MTGLVQFVVGLMFVWTVIAVTETAGIAVLPRTAVSLHMMAH